MTQSPSPGQPSRPSQEDLQAGLRQLPEWRIAGGKLTRSFRFADFMGAVEFVNRLAGVAEEVGHHPDLRVGWGLVVVELTSHDAGGITSRDLDLASRIDRL